MQNFGNQIGWGLFAVAIVIGLFLFLEHDVQPQVLEDQQQMEARGLIEMGTVRLHVKDLTLMRDFYTRLVGLEVLNGTESEVVLGYQDRSVLSLISTDLPTAIGGEAGLYHSAIVFSSRSTLAQSLERILKERRQFYEGSSDHLVSEAFYFSDPEGNGLELYFDKDSTTWQWQDGRVVMGSRYIDVEQYIRTYAPTNAALGKKMGHIHLRVGDIVQAKQFYVDYLGLIITAERPDALFVSDGVYHHHIGMNVWESRGAGKRVPSLGLKEFELVLESKAAVEVKEERLKAVGIEVQPVKGGFKVNDPWNNTVVVLGE